MANRKIAYTLGKGRAYIFDICLQNPGALFLKKTTLSNVVRSEALPEYMGVIFLNKKLEQRSQKLGASKNMGAILLGKKQP